MKRREFLKTMLAAPVAGLAALAVSSEVSARSKMYVKTNPGHIVYRGMKMVYSRTPAEKGQLMAQNEDESVSAA